VRGETCTTRVFLFALCFAPWPRSASAAPFADTKPAVSSGSSYAPREIRTPDLRFRSFPFAGILRFLRAIQGVLVQLAQVRIA
jgi:hypothetical protein